MHNLHYQNRRHEDGVMESIIEHSPSIAMRVEGKNGFWAIKFISKNISAYGYDREDFLKGTISWREVIHPDDLGSLCEELGRYERQRAHRYTTHYRIRTAQGEYIWVADLTTSSYDDQGRLLYSDCVISDYTETKRSLDKIEDNYRQQAVLNDILTGLHVSDPDEAFKIILDRTGTYLDISRVILFEDSADHSTCKAIYEWCNEGISSMQEQNGGDFVLNYKKDIPEVEADLVRSGVRAVNYGGIPEKSEKEFKNEGVIAAGIFSVYYGDDRYGFICFDECVKERFWEEDTLGFLKNISKLVSTAVMRKKNADALRLSQETCETVLDNINSFIYVSDPKTHCLAFANKAFKEEFGDDYEGLECWKVVNGSKTDSCLQCIKKMEESNEQYFMEVYMPRGGEWYGMYSSPVDWIDGRPMRLFSTQKITEKKLYEDNIKKLAFIDHLTGLPNRYRCDNDLYSAIQDARERDEIGHVVFIDMDDFKIVNDGYGHDYGDAILIEFAKFLRSGLPGVYQVYRFGGDEFVLLVNHGYKNDILKMVDTLINRARMPWKTKDRQFYCTVSVGIVQYPDGGCGVKEIIKNADVAMYQAKKTGKNSFAFYTDQMGAGSIERVEMEQMIRDAIQDNFRGFEVYYQPVIDTETSMIVAAEALIRWHNADGDLIMPSQFIPLSEYLGLIVPLGEFVLREASSVCREINENDHPDFQMSVNVSIRQFQQQDILSRIDAILNETGVEKRNILLEVTEGIAVDDISRMTIICNELRTMGVQIAMDDFGTGYSSLNNLRQLPIDVIKIDRGFIRDVTSDPYSSSFIRLITDLGHSMNRQVCVEGVETAEQLDYCQRNGANTLQGFYFSEPLPREAFFKQILG